jgi:hypothetical protein
MESGRIDSGGVRLDLLDTGIESEETQRHLGSADGNNTMHNVSEDRPRHLP